MEEIDIAKTASELMSDKALETMMQYCVTFGKNLLAAIVIYFIGRFIISKLTRLVRAVMQKKQIEPSLYSFVDSFLTICLHFVLIIAIVGVLGIETSSFVALFASAGVAIAMALSGTLQNFAGGVMILLFRPFRVGDFIEAQGYSGTVNQIQIFSTILTTVDNQTIIIPNGGLATGSLKNYSKQPYRRVDIDVEVAYGSKPDVVRKVLLDICLKDSRIMTQDAMKPFIPMTSMGASAIAFQVRVWTESANYWGVKFDTTEKIYNRLAEEGIEIPFQQIDVHMRS